MNNKLKASGIKNKVLVILFLTIAYCLTSNYSYSQYNPVYGGLQFKSTGTTARITWTDSPNVSYIYRLPWYGTTFVGNIRIPSTNSTSGQIFVGTNRQMHWFGTSSIWIGKNSGNFNTSSYNIGIGENALTANTDVTGNNIGIGYNALSRQTTGYKNIAIGVQAAENLLTSHGDIFIGHGTDIPGVNRNHVIDIQEWSHNSTSYHIVGHDHQVVIGSDSIQYINLGPLVTYNSVNSNYGVGLFATASCQVAGNSNISIGDYSLQSSSTGSYNIGIGTSSLQNNITGSYNTYIGNLSKPATSALNNTIALGYGITISKSNEILLGDTGNFAFHSYQTAIGIGTTTAPTSTGFQIASATSGSGYMQIDNPSGKMGNRWAYFRFEKDGTCYIDIGGAYDTIGYFGTRHTLPNDTTFFYTSGTGIYIICGSNYGSGTKIKVRLNH